MQIWSPQWIFSRHVQVEQHASWESGEGGDAQHVIFQWSVTPPMLAAVCMIPENLDVCEFWITTQFEDFLIEPICALQPQSELPSSVRSATVIALLDAFGPNLRAKVVFSQVMSLLLLWHRNIHPNQPLMYKYAAVAMRSFQMVYRWKTWRSKHLAQGCHVAGAPHRLCEWHHWRCWGGKSCHEQIHGIRKV